MVNTATLIRKEDLIDFAENTLHVNHTIAEFAAKTIKDFKLEVIYQHTVNEINHLDSDCKELLISFMQYHQLDRIVLVCKA